MSDDMIIGVVIGVICLIGVTLIAILINKRHLMKFQRLHNRSVSISKNQNANGNSTHEKLKATTASIKPDSEDNYYYVMDS